MNDNIDDTSITQPEALQPTPPNEQKVNESDSDGASPAGASVAPPVKPKKKLTKQQLAIGAVVLAAVTVLAVMFFRASKFEKVKNKCGEITGMITGSGDYFMIDTSPFSSEDYENGDPVVIAFMQRDTEKKAIEAIRYANKELGFSDSVYSDMINTTAMMGRQSEENRKYKVSWTYHPDDGLEVTYTKK